MAALPFQAHANSGTLSIDFNKGIRKKNKKFINFTFQVVNRWFHLSGNDHTLQITHDHFI